MDTELRTMGESISVDDQDVETGPTDITPIGLSPHEGHTLKEKPTALISADEIESVSSELIKNE